MGCAWTLAIIVFISTGKFFYAVIAFVIGLLLDGRSSKQQEVETQKKISFLDNLLILFAFVMKADGRVSKMEVQYVRSFLEQNFGTDEANKRMLELRDLLKDNTLSLQQTCTNINRILNYSQKLEFLHFLFKISAIDSDISKQELNVIHSISSYLHISAWDFGTLQAMYLNNQNQGGYSSYQSTQTQLENAYKILQVNQDASNEEIKKSYRKLVVKYHPDKVASLGEQIQNQAKEKFQQINAAYELIKKERNFS